MLKRRLLQRFTRVVNHYFVRTGNLGLIDKGVWECACLSKLRTYWDTLV